MQGSVERAFVLCVIKRTGQCLASSQDNSQLRICCHSSCSLSKEKERGIYLEFSRAFCGFNILPFQKHNFSFGSPFTQNVNVEN